MPIELVVVSIATSTKDSAKLNEGKITIWLKDLPFKPKELNLSIIKVLISNILFIKFNPYQI
jgi:hypothetical protein